MSEIKTEIYARHTGGFQTAYFHMKIFNMTKKNIRPQNIFIALMDFPVWQYMSIRKTKEGKLIKTHIKNFDGWLNGTIDYEHDKPGKISCRLFNGKNAYNAVLKFTYNERGLLIEYIWEFSTGDFQKYNFECENDK